MKGVERKEETEKRGRTRIKIKIKNTERNIKTDPNPMNARDRETKSKEKGPSLQVGIAHKKEEPSLTSGTKTSTNDLVSPYLINIYVKS